MSFLQRAHPWNPGYAIPGYVLDEPPQRGTHTTNELPRGTYDQIGPHSGGYTEPGYVLAERGRGGQYGTKMLPRGTVLGLPGDFLRPASGAPRGAPTAIGACYERAAIGEDLDRGGFRAGNPIQLYGEEAAELIVGTIDEVPAGERMAALRVVLDAVSPTLWTAVQERLGEFGKRGMPAKEALYWALAESMSEGMGKELVRLGRSGKVPTTGHLGLGATVANGRRRRARPLELGGFLGGLTSGAVKWTGKAIKGIGGLSCKVVRNPAVPIVAAGVATAYGVPPQVGYAGATVAQGICTKKGKMPPGFDPGMYPGMSPGMYPGMYPQPRPPWLMPALIGGGVLVLVLVLKK